MKTACREKTCHCGRPLHYRDETTQRAVEAIIDMLGQYVKVKVGGRAWMVQRHYVALHGIRAAELPFLGFKEVRP